MDNSENVEGVLRDNVELNRFELVMPHGVSFVNYDRTERRIVLQRAVTPEELRGHGYAAQVSRFALETARREGLRVTINCSYIVDFVERNPEFAELVD